LTMCEHCGQPGTLNRSRPWIRTLCEPCGTLWSHHKLSEP
jgi:hypothetical protein